MKYSLHPEAVWEFDKVCDYYGEIQANLGENFEDDFDDTLQRVHH